MDNFKQIRSLLQYKAEGDFYFIQIFKRKKDNPELSSHEKLIHSYSIFSLEEYDKLEDHIKALCDLHNARAYIRLNKRNSKHIALKMASDIIDKVACNQANSLYKIYDSIVGQYHSDENKTWLIDVDGDEDLMYEVVRWLELSHQISPYSIKTINGYHLIVKPFDAREFRKKYQDITIHKDNPSLLYFKPKPDRQELLGRSFTYRCILWEIFSVDTLTVSYQRVEDKVASICTWELFDKLVENGTWILI